MDDSEATSLERVRAFLKASGGTVQFAGRRREEVYGWIERTRARHHYAALKRLEKGLVRRYIARMTGLSRAQVARLIQRYIAYGHVKPTPISDESFLPGTPSRPWNCWRTSIGATET